MTIKLLIITKGKNKFREWGGQNKLCGTDTELEVLDECVVYNIYGQIDIQTETDVCVHVYELCVLSCVPLFCDPMDCSLHMCICRYIPQFCTLTSGKSSNIPVAMSIPST